MGIPYDLRKRSITVPLDPGTFLLLTPGSGERNHETTLLTVKLRSRRRLRGIFVPRRLAVFASTALNLAASLRYDRKLPEMLPRFNKWLVLDCSYASWYSLYPLVWS